MAGDAKTYTFERIKKLGLAPTFKKIPESLFAYSRPVYEEEAEHDPYWRSRMEGAYAKWAHTVKPLEILHWGDPSEIPSLIRKGAELLRQKQVEPSAVMGDPDLLRDVTRKIPIEALAPFMRRPYFIPNFALSYNEGFYLLNDDTASLYLHGRASHVWNIPPYSVNIVGTGFARYWGETLRS